MGKRPLVLATLAVFLVGGAGAAAVFFVGSAQRRDDRAAFRAYQRAVGPSLRAIDRIAEQVNPTLRALGDGSLPGSTTVARAAGWQSVLVRARADVIALGPPAFLGDIERRWVLAIDGYVRTARLVQETAGATRTQRASLLDVASVSDDRADELLLGAERLMRFHRLRLGLNPTKGMP